MSRLPQAGPTSDRLQKRGEQRRGAEDHDPKCEPWQKRNAPNPKKEQKDGIAGPAHASAHKGPGSRMGTVGMLGM